MVGYLPWSMVVVASCYRDAFHLWVLDETMYYTEYCAILEEHLIASTRQLKMKRNRLFQQGNDPKHTSFQTKKWLKMSHINCLEWPSQSPDLNPIENLWRELKVLVGKTTTVWSQRVTKNLSEKMEKISFNYCSYLVSSYKNGFGQVLANKGYATRYWMYYFIVVTDAYLPPIFRFSYIAYVNCLFI